MYFNEFDTIEVKGWIEDAAQKCADDSQWCDGVSLDTRVTETCDECITYQRDMIMLIAYYGASDVVAGCEFEDSPYAQFENDVAERARQIMGIDE